MGNWPNNAQVVFVGCNQWGDTGKGKVVDSLAPEADICARGQGGSNAGHSAGGHVFHLMPSSILCKNVTQHIIGNGVAFHPGTFLDERATLIQTGESCDNISVALNAKLVLPPHLLMDRILDSHGGNIGTTGRGIGPTYVDSLDRQGLIVNDMLNPDIFAEKLKCNLVRKRCLLQMYDPEVIKEIMFHPLLGGGDFYSPNGFFSEDAIIECYLNYGKVLDELQMIDDTDALMLQAHQDGLRILGEGAQGLLISSWHKNNRFRTCSDSSVFGWAQGVGLDVRNVDLAYGIVKFPIPTRVGEGSMPCELGGDQQRIWCRDASHNRDFERQFADDSPDDEDEFVAGRAFRVISDEYGATTGRPRRPSWLDLPLLRLAISINGPIIGITKIDIGDHCDRVKICTDHVYDGPDQRWGRLTLRRGDILHVAILDDEVLQHCRPVYKEFLTWSGSVRDCKSRADFPPELERMISFIEEEAGCKAGFFSVGKERERTIFSDIN